MAAKDNVDNAQIYNGKLELDLKNRTRSTTKINFSLPKNCFINLDIYNIKGEKIKELINNKSYQLGNHSIIFESDLLPSGIYFYHIQTNDWEKTKKMMLVK